MNYLPNNGKKLIVIIDGVEWARYPVKTHFIGVDDELEKILENYVLPFAQGSDLVVLGQKIISILQKRVILKKNVKVGFWAKFLSRFVKKTSAGFSVGNPLKMQLAINLAGLPRILLASFLAIFFKIFRIYGIFYRVAGNQISQIDGFYGEAFSQYAEMGILGPRNCDQLCQELKKRYNLSFVVADVNDLGGNILGNSSNLSSDYLLKILKDNPACQEREQTPIIICRQLVSKIG